MMYRTLYGPAGGGGLIFAILSLIFWVAVVWLVVSLIINFSHNHGHSQHWLSHEDPLELAKARYAKGEISQEEFNRIKKDLAS